MNFNRSLNAHWGAHVDPYNLLDIFDIVKDVLIDGGLLRGRKTVPAQLRN